MSEFHVSQLTATFGTALCVLGYAVGPMLWSPLSEVPSIGRNNIYLVTLTIYILFQFPIALAQNIETLLVFRFLTGFVGSPALATGGATVADMYSMEQRSYGLGLWQLSTWIGPSLGPLIGGFAAQSQGWRWTEWVLVWINVVVLFMIFCFLPETSGANILYRRARRLHHNAGPENALRCENKPIQPARSGRMSVAYETLVRPFVLCFQEPICILLNAYTALICGLFFIWLESFPIVFSGIYDFNLVEVGLAFIGLLIGSFVAFGVFIAWFHFTSAKDSGCICRLSPMPEERFVPLMWGCIFIPACLFIFGWSARKDIHWMLPILGSSLFSIGGFSLFVRLFDSSE